MGAQRVALAVVIVSYNVRELLRRCLQATFASLALSPELDAQVWVVDNASADGSAAMVAGEFPKVCLVASQENLGFAGGNNVALRALGFPDAKGEATPAVAQDVPRLVLLLNPDAEPQSDAIGAMARFLISNADAGGAGAQLSYSDGRFQQSAFRFPGLVQLWFDLFPPRPRRLLESSLNGRYPRRLYELGEPFPVDFPLGAALMVQGAAIEAVGLLDETYFMYAEEVDWCWRMQRAGWRFYCVPTALVVHHAGSSASQFRARSSVNLWRSRHRLYARFYSPLKRRAAGAIVRLGMLAEVRRANAAAAKGEISLGELGERTEAAEEVMTLFGASR